MNTKIRSKKENKITKRSIKIITSNTFSYLLLFFYWVVISSCTRAPLPSADPNPVQYPQYPNQYPSADGGLPSVQNPRPLHSKRNLIVQQSYNKIGIPYKYAGSTLSGFDCSGLTQYVYRQAGISIPRTTKKQLSSSQTIAYQQLLPGDLAFYKTGTNTRHVGIYIGNNQMIHASTGSKRVRTANITDSYWRQRFTKFGRFINSY